MLRLGGVRPKQGVSPHSPEYAFNWLKSSAVSSHISYYVLGSMEMTQCNIIKTCSCKRSCI